MLLVETIGDRRGRKRGETGVVAGWEHRSVNRMPTDASRRSIANPRGGTEMVFGASALKATSVGWPRPETQVTLTEPSRPLRAEVGIIETTSEHNE